MNSHGSTDQKRMNLSRRLLIVSLVALVTSGASAIVFNFLITGLSNALIAGFFFVSVMSAILGYVVSIYIKKSLAPIDDLAESMRSARPGHGGKVVDVAESVSGNLSSAIKEMTDRYEAIIRKSYKMSISDPITGLANRTQFLKKTDDYISVAGERTVSVVIIDLDKFSRINDKFGPQLADELLSMVGSRIRAYLKESELTFRTEDECSKTPCILSRLSADVFAIVIPHASQKIVEKMVELIRFQLEKPFSLDGRIVELSAMYAAASSPEDGTCAVELMKHADFALKTAKEGKFKNLRFYDSSMQETAQRNLTLEDDIRRGIENHEFVPVFQPKVELETGLVCGAEALARWRRPDGAVVSPGVFIPKTEEMGLIPQMGENILRDACAQAAKWDFNGQKPRLAVNVSPLQFEDPNFVSIVNDILEETKLPPECLELELTETAAVDNPDRVAKIMRPLRARGVRFAIDDFGTGHSNFTTVTRLPFDVFKIDQQFVRAHGSDPHAPAIIEMILAMAEALDQETVAEGVETQEHYEFLRRRACTIGQGYFFSPPLPAHEFEAFVHHWRAPSLTKKFA